MVLICLLLRNRYDIQTLGILNTLIYYILDKTQGPHAPRH